MIEYTVEIFPDAPRPALGVEHKEVRLTFKDQETKTKYVKAEGRFVQEEFLNYLTAETRNKKSTQRALDLKRVTFAKQNGYFPKKGNKFIWEFTPGNGGDEPKRYA